MNFKTNATETPPINHRISALHNCVVIVMGVSGSGKSTLAQALANHYGITYLDADDFHSNEARSLMAQGIPLTDAQRAPWVERIKERLTQATPTNEAFCLAFSGLKKHHRDSLRTLALPVLFLHLEGSKATIQTRLNQRKNHFMAATLLDSQFAALEHPQQESDVYSITVDADIPRIMAQAIHLIDQHQFA